MNDKTRSIVVVIYAISAAVVFIGGALTLLWSLATGRYVLPAGVQQQIFNFFGIVLTAAGIWLSNRALSKRIDDNREHTAQNFVSLDQRLQNGLGSVIASKVDATEIAAKVVEQLPAPPTAVEGGQRSYDPPGSSSSTPPRGLPAQK